MYWTVYWELVGGGGRKKDGGGMLVSIGKGAFCWNCATPCAKFCSMADCVLGADSDTVMHVSEEETDMGDEGGVLGSPTS